MTTPASQRPLVAAGLLLGVGLGGFLDGIVFHQILQWHNMVSARYPTAAAAGAATDPAELVRNAEVNMFWDGVFHAFCWAATLLGVHALFRCGRRADPLWSGRTLGGSMLAGWGLFNLTEGVIDHHLLHAHHVREALGESAWDYGFLAVGAALAAGGFALVRSDARPVPGPA